MNEKLLLAADESSPWEWSVHIAGGHQARLLRSAFREHILRYASADSDIAAAELIFAELLANVISHAPGPAQAHLSWKDVQPTPV